MKITFSILLLSLLQLRAYCQQKQLDSLFNHHQKNGRFDGSVLIAKGKNIIYEKQYGLANRQFNVPVNSTTKFPIASISKLYASVLTLKLQEEGKLNIDSPVSAYLPTILPHSAPKITIRQLLNHTSGLPNEKIADYMTLFTPANFMGKRIKDTLLFSPGTKYRYNNVNFILLTCIIEKTGKNNWESLLSDKLLVPFKYQQTGVTRRDSVIQNLASGYYNYAFGNEKVKDPLQNNYPLYLENYAFAGALHSTAKDLFKFVSDLRSLKIINQQSFNTLYQPFTAIGTVEKRNYHVCPGGYIGSEIIGTKETNLMERNGNIGGFNATYLYLPKSDHTVIILTNTDAGDLKTIANEAIRIISY